MLLMLQAPTSAQPAVQEGSAHQQVCKDHSRKEGKKAIGNTTMEHSQLKLLLVQQIYIFMAIIHSAELKIQAMKINQFFSVAKKMF